MNIYSVIVKDYCFQRRLSSTDTDDVIQEVMRKVSSAIRSFDYDPTKGRFRAWLGTVAANTIKSHMTATSRRSSKHATETDFGKPLESSQDPDSAWVEIYSERIFSAACKDIRPRFNPTTWACFESTWIQQKSARQVATELSIPIHSVYVNKSRVLKSLEEKIRYLAGDLPTIDISANDTD